MKRQDVPAGRIWANDWQGMGVEENGRSIPEADERLADSRNGRRAVERGLSVAGLDATELEIVLRYLPADFLAAYVRLVDRGVGEKALGSGGGSGGAGADVVDPEVGRKSLGRIKTSTLEFSLTAKTSGKKTARSLGFKSEVAVDFRRKVDRKLRKVIREVNQFLVEVDDMNLGAAGYTPRSCGGKCKRRGEPEWLYCPNCGGIMQDMTG